MNSQQKAFVVRCNANTMHGLDDLNQHLSQGWRVRHVQPMGASGMASQAPKAEPHFASLVVIEHAGEVAETAMLEAEESFEGMIEDLVEGDGSSVEVEEGIDLERDT
jgi:hypothetical protein